MNHLTINLPAGRVVAQCKRCRRGMRDWFPRDAQGRSWSVALVELIDGQYVCQQCVTPAYRSLDTSAREVPGKADIFGKGKAGRARGGAARAPVSKQGA